MMSGAQRLSPTSGLATTYRAPTDGLVIGFVPTSGTGIISGVCGPLNMSASYTGQASASNSFVLPVPANALFMILTISFPFMAFNGLFYFIPFGTGNPGPAQVQQMDEGTPIPQEQVDRLTRRVNAREDFVAALGDVLGPIPDDARDRLLDALNRIG